MTDANVLEHETQLAWEEHCALIQLWVTQGYVSARAGAYACDDGEKELWIQAYLCRGQRTIRVGRLGELDGSS